MAQITGGELLLRCLQAEGITTVFGVLDGSHNPILAKLADYGIRFISARHEAAAAHMAEAWARVRGESGVVITGIGPGALNTTAGVGVAHAEGTPLVVITGQRRRNIIYPDRGGGFQVADLIDLYRPITKWSVGVRHWERLPEIMARAFRVALSGRPGPVYVEIPEDLLKEAREEDEVQVEPPTRYRAATPGPGDPAAIARAADLLAEATSPLLHAGMGVSWAGAWEEFRALADYLGAVVTTTLPARGVVPEDHPHYIHLLDQETLLTARREADVILAVGTRFGELDGWGRPPWWGDPNTQKTIHIDVDPTSIGLNRPVDVGIVGDARMALQALLEAVQARTGPREPHPHLERYRESTAAWQRELATALDMGMGGINPGRMVQVVRDFFPREAITVMDGGNTSLWVVSFNPIYTPRSFLYTAKFGHLGSGLPYAIGAQMAAPDRPVYLITGDGALGFNVQELETAVRYNVPITVIVAVDKGWGMERTSQLAAGIRGFVETEFYPETRYDLVAQGFGCHGEMVERLEDLRPALERARASGRPALIQVMVDAMANMSPPGIRTFATVRMDPRQVHQQG